jgi:hypothetical protein
VVAPVRGGDYCERPLEEDGMSQPALKTPAIDRTVWLRV